MGDQDTDRCAVVRRLVGAALLAALTIGSDTTAAVCRLQGAGQWGPVDTYTGPDDCGGVYGEDDRFVVEGDVEVVTDIVQSTTPSAGIEVVAGGALGTAVGTASLRIVVGPWGLVCRDGSACDLEGGFRAPRDADGVSAGDVTADFTSDSHWALGAPIPCPGWDASEGIWQPDCAGSLQDAGDLPGSNTILGGHAAAPLEPGLATALDLVGAGEVFYFLDPDPADADAPHEAGFHYDVAAAQGADLPGGPTGGFLHLDVRQGTAENGYAQSRRTILACELINAPGKRDREIFTRNDCIAADFERDGHWLRFEANETPYASCPGTAAAPCRAESRAWRIQASENDAACPGGGVCDRFLLADARGLDGTRTAGGTLWINQVGAGEGDTGVMMVPVRIGSATPAVDEGTETDTAIHLGGDVDVAGVAFERVGAIEVGAPGAFHLERFEDVFVREPTSGGQIGLLFLAAGDVTLRRVTMTGGDQFGLHGSGGGGDDHGIAFLDGPFPWTNATLEDVSVRYTWDDFIVTGGDGSAPASLTLRRVRVQFEGVTIQSQSGLNTQSGTTDVFVEDFECVDCSDDERPMWLVGVPRGSVKRVLFLAPKSDVIVSVDGPIEDLTAIGGLDFSSTQLIGPSLRRCVLRENGSVNAGVMISGASIDFSQCLIRGNRVALDLIGVDYAGGDLAIRDSLILDNFDSDGQASDVIDCRNLGPSGSCIVERTTIGFSTNRQIASDGHAIGINGNAVDDGRQVTLSENVFFGLSQGFRMSSPEEATLQRLCFENNALDSPATHLAWVVDPAFEALGLRDADRGALDPLPGSTAEAHPCGFQPSVSPPGVCQRLWVHAVNGLEPECAAPSCSNGADDDFDGLRDFPEDPSCESAESDAEAFAACEDGVDNDGDGLVDMDDPGCPFGAAGLEDPVCDDGLDNDGDELVDFDDPHCSPSWPYQEKPNRSCGLGPGALVLSVALLALRKKRHGRHPGRA